MSLSYLGTVSLGLRVIKDKYPDAQLLEAKSGTPDGMPTRNTSDLTLFRMICRSGDGIVYTTSKGGGDFTPPAHVPAESPEDEVIQWPIYMDISKAAEILEEAGFDAPYAEVVLRHPQHSSVDEPCYIFHQIGHSPVLVGTKSRRA